jgi:Co/Zn/Cd efflux system component
MLAFATLSAMALNGYPTPKWVVLGCLGGFIAATVVRFVGNMWLVESAQQFSRREELKNEKRMYLILAILIGVGGAVLLALVATHG